MGGVAAGGSAVKTRRFKQVDVFTAQPFRGNPVAVVLEADGLATDDMQRIARWTNLSETTFVLPSTSPAADYRLRIFTPSSELPFAGHPSVGSAHAIIEAGIASPRDGRLVQECGAGLLPLDVEAGRPPTIFVTAPAPATDPIDAEALAALSRALGAAPVHPPLRVSVGAVWLIVPLADAATVAGLAPDMNAVAEVSRRLRATGVTVFGPHAGGPDAFAVRSFAPAEGIPEDPVCGSGNAATGWYVATHPAFAAFRAGYSASQGREIGRDGRVQVRFADGRVRIGGTSITCVDGVLTA
jgi:PhzF family phenazine biosynthesis protein